MKVKIKHKPHAKAKWLLRMLGLPFKYFPQGFVGWADDMIQKMGVHATTHIDAPWHYSPTTQGQKAKTIDEMPLELGFADGIVIDMKHKVDFDAIKVADIEQFLAECLQSLHMWVRFCFQDQTEPLSSASPCQTSADGSGGTLQGVGINKTCYGKQPLATAFTVLAHNCHFLQCLMYLVCE